MRSAPGRRMFGASAWSLSVTFSSLAASLSSVTASHCCRAPASYQTARHRPPPDLAGYTVIPHSNSMTSSPPRVESRPVPAAITLGRAGAPLFPALRALPGRPRLDCGDSGGTVVRGTDRPAVPRRSCGEPVGILARLGAAIVIRDTLFLPYAQVREPTRRR